MEDNSFVKSCKHLWGFLWFGFVGFLCVLLVVFFFSNLPKVVENRNITSLPDNE